jgi:predicted small metal-binding protein
MSAGPNQFTALPRKGTEMSREIHCRDVGPDCDATVVAERDDDILEQVAEHAKSAHGMTDEQVSDPSFIAHVRNQIHDKSAAD